MTWFTRWAFGNKAAVMLIVALSLVVGIFSYATLPMELLPEADNPQVTITTIGPSKDARTMEQQVTTPIEEAVLSVKGKSGMFSQTGDGFSQINMNFDSKTNMKDAKAEVQEAIASLQFPEGVMNPFVLQLNTSMIPVAQITLAFEGGLTDENVKRVEDTVVPAIQKLDGVSNVVLYGKTTPKIMIEPNMQKLTELQIPVQAIYSVLEGKEVSVAIGEQNIDGMSGNVKVQAEVQDLSTLKKLPLVPGVVLEDVANVRTTSGQESISQLNGNDILFMMVSKEANANQVAVGHAVEQRLEELNGDIEGADFNMLMNTSDTIQSSVNHMMQEVLLGALFATIVILLFLRNFKATLITAVSIPLSLGITLYLLSLSGVTLNIITLGGVAVAVGRLVDDSIVVIENIFRRMQKEALSKELILNATREVAGAITSSTITTVVVFLPMGLLRGSLQDFLLPFALTVSYSLLASLLVALTVVPIMSAWLLKNSKLKEHQPSKRFASFLKWNLDHKWLPLVLSVALFVGSIWAYAAMPKGALDASDATFMTAGMEFESDTPIDTVIAKGQEFAALLQGQEGVKYVLMEQGNNAELAQWGEVDSPTNVTLTMVMEEDGDAQAVIDLIENQKPNYENAQLSVGQLSMMGSTSTNINIDLLGGTEEERRAAAAELVQKIREVEHVEKVSSNMDATKPVFYFNVDPTAANAQQIAMQLQMMLNPVPIGSIQLEDAEAQVLVDAIVKPSSQQDLTSMQIQTEQGLVPITSVASFEETEEATVRYHKDGKDYIRVSASAVAEQLSVVGADMNKIVNDMEVAEDLEIVVGGASADQMQDLMDLFVTMLLSIAIVYLVMVMTFKTIRAPLAIMFSLPLAFIGAVLGLIITGINPDFTAAFGVLMLIGIVVTNAIVLIDRVRHNEETMTIRDAVLEAATTRMRPILMTAIATICAMMPLLFMKTEMGNIVSQSLAIVVIGGLTTATALTLIIVPVVYEGLYFRKSKKQRKAQAALANGETHSV
ncbi:efflux RND transporter permease subunit [Marinicrinis sediminis]|uniref:Efflux RND transporter permease subunit n=1 Tax=Marinicrinis sediminis TaxID=1652465 RepID=A0ABW5R7B9_9BACL